MMIITENNKVAAEKLLNKSSKLTDLEKTEYFKKLYELDVTSKRYPDNPKFLITLVKWFLEDPIERQYNLIKLEFETYLEQVRLNHWKGADVTIKDISKFPKFQNFATEVHRISAKYRKGSDEEKSANIVDLGSKIEVLGKKIDKKDVTYQTDDVVVVKVDNMQKSIEYGSGFSDWCTARTSGNYFYKYRFGEYGEIGKSTLYYVYFPKRYSEDRNDHEAVLNFGVNENGDISYTDRSNSERVESLSWLQNHFPEFKGANMKEIFPHTDITPKESEINSLPDRMNDDEFYALSNDDKLMYLQSSSDRNINLNKFKSMSDNLKSSYLGIVENSQLLLNTELLYYIKDTAFGRRYIKNMTVDNINSLSRDMHEANGIFYDRNMVLEIISSIIENKKDNMNHIMVSTLLRNSYYDHYKQKFIDQKQFLDIVNKLGPANINKLERDEILGLLRDASFNPEHGHNIENMANSLGNQNLLKLKPIDYINLLDYAYHRSAPTLLDFVVKQVSTSNSTTISELTGKILRTAKDINKTFPGKYNVENLILQLIDSTKFFSDEFVAEVLTHTSRISDVINRIGAPRYNLYDLGSKQLLRILINVNSEESLNEFEKFLGPVLTNLNSHDIDNLLNSSEDLSMYDQKVDLLIKYTLNKWNGHNLISLLRTSDDKKIEYINRIGKSVFHIVLSNKGDLISVLKNSTNVLAIIESLDVDYVVSKLNVRDYVANKLINRNHGDEEEELSENLVKFILDHYDISAEDIVLLYRSFNNHGPINLYNLLSDVNREKIQPMNVYAMLDNRYLDVVSYRQYLRLYKDKILQLDEKQINMLLELEAILSVELIQFLIDNKYNFTNQQMCTILFVMAKWARQNGHYSDDILEKYVKLIGPEKIINIDNDSIYKLIDRGFTNLEFLLKYVPSESLTGETIALILRKSNSLHGDPSQFVRVFKILENSLNKLSQVPTDVLMDLMCSGYQPASRLFDYFTTKNPEMLTPEVTFALLRKMLVGTMPIGNASGSQTVDDWYNEIGHEKINKVLDEVNEQTFNIELFAVLDYSFRFERAFSLLKILSPSNLAKINDNTFYWLVKNLSEKGNYDIFLRKPNLNRNNVVNLLKYAYESYLQSNFFESVRPQINQLTEQDIFGILSSTPTLYVSRRRVLLLLELLGKVNTNKLGPNSLFNILYTSSADHDHFNRNITLEIFWYFKDVLYKLSPDQINKLQSLKQYKFIDIQILSFIGNKQLTADFINRIKQSDYRFLQTFTNMFFYKNLSVNVKDYLKVIAEYIRSHNNTLNYTEFEVILREIEKLNNPDTLNSVLHFLSKVLKTKLYSYLKTYNVGRKYNDKVVKEYKRFYSDLLLEDSSFSQENLDKALDIERRAYPPHMQLINSYIEGGGTLDIYDIADYLECEISDIVFYMGDNWFIIGCVKGNELEIADWASDGGMSPGAIKKFFKVLSQYKDKTISCSARETTSYKLIKNAEKLGYVTIFEEEKWNWGGVNMIDMRFKFTDTLMNRISRKKKTDEIP